MMKKNIALLAVAMVIGVAGVCSAHFGMVIPSDTMVMQDDARTIQVVMSFSHPHEMMGMDLVKPKEVSVVANGTKSDLLGTLKKSTVMKKMAWTTDYKITRPGAYIFYMEPTPYFEPAENCYIIHYTKTVVAAFGDDEGWDTELGLKTEIVPLAKPFALYTGNVFQGIVKVDGKPIPYAEVEVEYYNEKGTLKAPTDYMITQTVKADQNGVFTYAAPVEGWWGFAALNTADFQLRYDGENKDVELGAVIWVRFFDGK